jgi:hypothetical protein
VRNEIKMEKHKARSLASVLNEKVREKRHLPISHLPGIVRSHPRWHRPPRISPPVVVVVVRYQIVRCRQGFPSDRNIIVPLSPSVICVAVYAIVDESPFHQRSQRQQGTVDEFRPIPTLAVKAKCPHDAFIGPNPPPLAVRRWW